MKEGDCMDKEHIPNFEQPITGVTWFKPEQCGDCIFRDKITYQKDGKAVECGWNKSSCVMYPYPQMKPDAVMRNKEECEYYEKEKKNKK